MTHEEPLPKQPQPSTYGELAALPEYDGPVSQDEDCIIAVRDHVGRSWTTGYDPQGRLVKVRHV